VIAAGLALARRLEWAEASNDSACTTTHGGASVARFGGGYAVFAGAQSPLTRAIGLGLSGPGGDAEAQALADFFHSRGAKLAVDWCPLADAGLLEALGRRGLRPAEFSNVMVKDLAGAAPYAEDPRIRIAPRQEMELWARTVGQGFFESGELSEAEMDIGRTVFRVDFAACYLARTEGGEPAAGAAMSVRDGIALLFADSTVAHCRRAGFHASLIRGRLNAALLRGCDLASATTSPGSASQRNYERMGFQVAYTRVLLLEP
jgi:hypothetical protein